MILPLFRELEYQCDSAPLMQRLNQLDSPLFLDSSMNSDRGARYDILTAAPTVKLLLDQGFVYRVYSDEKQQIPGVDIFEAINQALAEFKSPASEFDEVLAGLPFVGGAAGYFSYEIGAPGQRPDKRRDERTEQEYPHTPTAQTGIYHWAVIVDHLLQKSILFLLPQCPPGIAAQVLAALESNDNPADSGFQLTQSFSSNLSRQAYEAAFDRLKAYINAGDCYQTNLAQRFQACYDGDPLEAYLRLRQRSKSPFSAYVGLQSAPLQQNDKPGAILCLSPERFLQVRGRRVLTQPIKGTRRRGLDAAQDEALKKALCESEKDRAENLMIVDLLRNDLGSLCLTGSVTAERLFELQSFNSVHHLVSTISAELGPEQSPLDLLRNCFPGGSITGAPKIRAMEIINELEPNSRSIYCGAIGYFGFDGQMDTNITIRTLLCEQGQIYCWGGGGIVADSECELEYQESRDKVALLLSTLQETSC
jgi:para-aminobenzoate synthetase component I